MEFLDSKFLADLSPWISSGHLHLTSPKDKPYFPPSTLFAPEFPILFHTNIILGIIFNSSLIYFPHLILLYSFTISIYLNFMTSYHIKCLCLSFSAMLFFLNLDHCLLFFPLLTPSSLFSTVQILTLMLVSSFITLVSKALHNSTMTASVLIIPYYFYQPTE